MPFCGKSKVLLINLLGAFLVLVSSFLISLQAEEVLDFYWIGLVLPLAVGIALFPISLHLYLTNLAFPLKSLTRFVLIFTGYCTGISIVMVSILVGVKLDDMIEVAWSTVFIPIWFGLFIYLILCFFMTPGLVNSRVGMYRQTILLYVYFLGLLGFSILLAVKLDCGSPRQWSIVHVPIWIVQFVHLMSLLVKCWPDHASDTQKEITFEHTFLTYFIVQTISMYFVLESLPIQGYVALLPLWLVMIHTLVNETYEAMNPKEELSSTTI